MKREEMKPIKKRINRLLVLLCISICIAGSTAGANEMQSEYAETAIYRQFSMEERHGLLLMAKWDYIRKVIGYQNLEQPESVKTVEAAKKEYVEMVEEILAVLSPLKEYKGIKEKVYLLLSKEVDEKQHPEVKDIKSYEEYIQSLTDLKLEEIWIPPLEEAGLLQEIAGKTELLEFEVSMEERQDKQEKPEGTEEDDYKNREGEVKEKEAEQKEAEQKKEEEQKNEKNEEQSEGIAEKTKQPFTQNTLAAAGTTTIGYTLIEQEGSGYWVYNYITSSSAITKTQYYAWTIKDGQDELTCVEGTVGNWVLDGKNYNWRCYINQNTHKSEWGIYATHLYVTEKSGAVDCHVLQNIDLQDKGAKTVTNFRELKTAATDSLTKEIIIMQSITMTESIHLSARKNLVIRPGGANYTLTMQKKLPSGFIAQGTYLEIAGSKFHGNVFTLGINGGQNTEAATGAKYPSVITAKSSDVKIGQGASIFNGGGHGVLGEHTTTIYTDGAKIYQNKYAGIGTWGAIDIKSTDIFQNDTAGKRYGAIHLNTERTRLNASIQDCSIYDNKDSGINVIPTADKAGRIIIHKTKVEQNGFQGIMLRHKGLSIISSGTVKNNADVGIVNQSKLLISIEDSGLSAEQKKGAYVQGVLKVSGNRGQGIINEGTCEMKGVEVANQSTQGVWNTGTLILAEETVNHITYPLICNNLENGVVNQSGTMTVEHASVTENGRGIFNQAKLYWKSGTIKKNIHSGGIHNTGTLEITGGNIEHNSGITQGGGIYNIGNCQITNAKISGNKAAIKGGGIYNYGELTIAGSDISSNYTGGYGGGIFNDKQCRIANSVLEGNQADGDGGGLCNYDYMVLTDITVSQNKAGRGRGIAHYKAGNTLQLKGSTVVLAPDDIFLADGTYVWAGADMQTQPGLIANITPQKYVVGRKVVQVEKAETNKQGKASLLLYTENQKARFELTEHSGTESIRPGDYLKSETRGETNNVIDASEMIISRTYSIKYHPNTTAQVSGCPGNDIKYWNEPKYLSEEIPKREPIRFLGWDENASKEEQPSYQPGDLFDENQDQNLYAVWEKDQPPVLEAEEVLTFYEGESVAKDQLLSNIRVSDREDDYTGTKLQVRITSIQYADGRLVDGKKEKGEKVVWEDDMPKEYMLDTWYLQLDPKDSPVTHKITYEVTDSAGNTALLNWTLKVKYNEFPVIEAPDRYFTLEEAQSGKITSEELKKQISASDPEDGNLTEKLELLGVQEEEFLHFQHSGHVICTYKVTDQYRKETVRQTTVYIIKDGEQPPGPEVSYFRFINRENYEKNAGIKTENLTDEQKKEYNQNGGLNVESKWYQEEQCRTLLNDTLNEKKTYEIWRFRPRDVIAVDQYIKEHGIGDSKSKQALTQFASEFGHLKEQS